MVTGTTALPRPSTPPSWNRVLRASLSLSTTASLIGRHIREWDMRPNWHADSGKVLLDILRKKFHSGEWTRRLLETGSAMLIDGNLHHETDWAFADA
jgi:predicted NAD-dependent protein-ADP-ribosyltransferase YbiA (DUF1768 family)